MVIGRQDWDGLAGGYGSLLTGCLLFDCDSCLGGAGASCLRQTKDCRCLKRTVEMVDVECVPQKVPARWLASLLMSEFR